MTFVKKTLSLCVLSSFGLALSANAETRDIRTFVDFDSDVRAGADALVQKIKDDPNNNHSPIPGHNAYKDLRIVSVSPDFQGFIEIDDATQTLKRLEVSQVSFDALGVPLFSNYKATLKLSADFTDGCQIVPGTRSYVVVKSNSSLVDALFNKDLTGRNYNSKYEAYGDTVFESMIQTNATLRALCQTAE